MAGPDDLEVFSNLNDSMNLGEGYKGQVSAALDPDCRVSDKLS